MGQAAPIGGMKLVQSPLPPSTNTDNRQALMIRCIPVDKILGSHCIETRSSRCILTSQAQQLQIRPPDHVARGKQTDTARLVGTA